ncbi:PA4780 family RIO1-like protein kinase [Aliiglaciecola sp. 3_MG-2023]|uniref:PA4780 family RIO1-like protein kinase n=1 Tax=Aliiglaciecola sp. 3_MG-2023 TaxID=3062644 RepID=UPI0026E46B5B|nr:PA4780 family RIO1-like protein kinase [Aliiglaciecola sp. 3_MG-2023]MDO6691703.1 PA4780 family RIO1-like protein kinase [Aliiglaciecola sp. 3_MG-2023]
MKIPKRLQPLVEDGLIDEVLYQLMSGKEATVFVVKSQGEIRCAKVYKEVMQRSFKKAAQYQEGRKVKNSRRARAMEKGSKFGRKQLEDAWQNAEVDALFTLSKAGVRVPQPFGCYDGVLLMELVTTENGEVAPRLNDVSMSKQQALEDHAQVMFYVMLMLCSGLVHGDLSEFNVLVDDYGPVIIDLPQAVNAAANNNAFSMLQRDVRNMTDYYGEFAPELHHTHYAEEMWALFEAGELTPETELTGQFEFDHSAADVDNVLEEIKAAFAEEEERLARIRAADNDE